MIPTLRAVTGILPFAIELVCTAHFLCIYVCMRISAYVYVVVSAWAKADVFWPERFVWFEALLRQFHFYFSDFGFQISYARWFSVLKWIEKTKTSTHISNLYACNIVQPFSHPWFLCSACHKVRCKFMSKSSKLKYFKRQKPVGDGAFASPNQINNGIVFDRPLWAGHVHSLSLIFVWFFWLFWVFSHLRKSIFGGCSSFSSWTQSAIEHPV